MFRIVLIAGTACMLLVMGNSAWILSVYTKDEQVLRSVKMMKIPMYSSCISFFLNIFFNYVFIFGKFGMPRLEIQGAAIGTLVARVCQRHAFRGGKQRGVCGYGAYRRGVCGC